MTHRKLSGARRGTSWPGLFLPVAGVLLGGIGGMITGSLSRPAPVPMATLPPSTSRPAVSQDSLAEMTILVLGVDATGNSGRAGLRGNTDTMLLLRLAPHDQKIYGFSIPRDTRVAIAGHGVFKINAACAWGGPLLTARTVADYLHLSIHRYVLLSLTGLVRAIDAIGGVDVTVPERLDYDDWTGRLHIHLQAGPQHLGGAQVEELLRFRHDRNGTDIARVGRQQDFLLEIARQFFRPAVALRLPALWAIASRHAETDLSWHEILDIARWLPRLDPARDIQMTVLPGDYRTIDHYCYWLGRPRDSAAFLDSRFGAALPLPVSPDRQPRVSLYDETGRHLNLLGLEGVLRRSGFMVQIVSRRKERTASSRVVVERGDVTTGKRLAAAVGLTSICQAAVGDLASDFTLELGEDWPVQPTFGSTDRVSPGRRS